MELRKDLEQHVAEFGAECEVVPPEGEARTFKVIVTAVGAGSINARNNVLSFIDKNILPRGAEWAYGLMLAESAPEGMNQETRLTIIEGTGATWECEAAKEVYEITEGRKQVIGWRMALRGTQRMVRG